MHIPANFQKAVDGKQDKKWLDRHPVARLRYGCVIRERKYQNDGHKYHGGNSVFAVAKKKDHPPKTRQGRYGEKHVLEERPNRITNSPFDFGS